MVRAIAVILLMISAASPAYAYLDPGSGGMLLYALAGIAAAVAYTLRGLFQTVVGLRRGRGLKEEARMDGVNWCCTASKATTGTSFSPSCARWMHRVSDAHT